jgi:hypothetical protein
VRPSFDITLDGLLERNSSGDWQLSTNGYQFGSLKEAHARINLTSGCKVFYNTDWRAQLAADGEEDAVEVVSHLALRHGRAGATEVVLRLDICVTTPPPPLRSSPFPWMVPTHEYVRHLTCIQ